MRNEYYNRSKRYREMASKKGRGRPNVLTPRTKNLFKAIRNGNRRRIDIGDEMKRWEVIKRETGVKTNESLAALLIDSYYSRSSPIIQHSTPIVHVGAVSEEYELSETELEVEYKTKKWPRNTNKLAESSYVSTFDITLSTSEGNETDDDSDSSDPDYVPSLNISLGPSIGEEAIDVEIGDMVFDVQGDDEVDETDIEEIGEGLSKLMSPDESKILTEDEVFLIYSKPLLKLASTKIKSVCDREYCTGCVRPTTKVKGSAIYIIWRCDLGHDVHRWCSQPILNRRLHGGDLMTSAAILFSGNNYSKIRLFAKFLNMRIVNATSYNLIQRTYLIPSVDEIWTEKQSQVISQFEGQDVVILGDGRMDSPGHSAQYCTYTVMEEETKQVLSCITIDKRHCGDKSTSMEKLGFTRSLDALKEKNISITEVVTDAHVQISSIMKKQYKEVKHSYDLWHVAKNLGKKITTAGQEKGCKSLIGWTRHVVNHFWYAAQQSSTYNQFIGIWFGLIHHVVNEHQWILAYGNEGQNSCCHLPLTEEERKIDWLIKGSAAHMKLKKIISCKRLLNNIPYFLNARSTAEMENFQNHILMYAGKRFSFTPPVYRARNLLAALDHNEHQDRQLALTKDGQERYQRLFNKKSKRYTAYPVKKSKTFPHIPLLMQKVVRRRLEDNIGMKRKMVLEEDDPRRIRATLAPAPPPTSLIVQEKKSRFSNCNY